MRIVRSEKNKTNQTNKQKTKNNKIIQGESPLIKTGQGNLIQVKMSQTETKASEKHLLPQFQVMQNYQANRHIRR